MIRAACLVAALVPAVAAAQEPEGDAPAAGGSSAGPGVQPKYETTVEARSPAFTQDRTFGATRFWKLDPGVYEVEVWWRVRDPRGPGHYQLVQAEIELGLTRRIQLDLYENLLIEHGELSHEGNQIEARIAIDPIYGRTWGNPVVYLEWHPMHLSADRAEARLLLGGEVAPKLLGAANLFYEQNVTETVAGFVPNPEMGVTASLSYAVAGQRARVGGEAKLAFEKEAWGDARWEKQLLVGPNVSARLAGSRFKVLATVLFGLTDDAKRIDSFVVVGSEL